MSYRTVENDRCFARAWLKERLGAAIEAVERSLEAYAPQHPDRAMMVEFLERRRSLR